ncbi:MAG: ATP12 family protein [Hyphomicrobiales bacterium]
MRDIFEEIFIEPPLDPTESARRNMRPQLRKRFYEKAGAGGGDGGFTVLLDGKPVRTPARRALAAPSKKLAQALATEWEAQVDLIDPALMPLTRLANVIIDAVADAPAPIAEEIEKYLGSDLVCYRAGEPEGLVKLQTQHWNPLLTWAREEFDARFMLAEGITYVAQPDSAIAAAAKAIPQDPWKLGATASITTLTGSALIALALAQGHLSMEAAWDAAHVDEDWQMSQWGRDEIALARRAYRLKDMQAAALVLKLA